MIKFQTLLAVLVVLCSSCNVVTEKYSLAYTTEEPNDVFAKKLEEVLEGSYNVDIILEPTHSIENVIDVLQEGTIDMGLVENLHNRGKGVHTVVPVFPKILHLLYKEDLLVRTYQDLFYDNLVYAGREGSASYEFILDLCDYYHLDKSRINLTNNMLDADVLAIFSVLMDDGQLANYTGFRLFSLNTSGNESGSRVEGIALRYPRVRPFILPEGTYGDLTPNPVHTIATDMVFVVREGMWSVTVSDLIRSVFAHREQFVHLHPSFYFGIIENFDRSKMSYSLHEGARAYLDRDEPGFFERYAELAGLVFTVILAVGSGLVSFRNRRKQKKKDKIDVYYGRLMEIKNQIPTIKNIDLARQKIQEVKEEQDKAFKMLINEELAANDSFRIYMQLSKETIDDIRLRLRLLKERKKKL